MENNSLKGKIIVNFGDSIFGNFRSPVDISTFISEYTGATVYNLGFGGCRMSQHKNILFDKFCMYRIVDAITTRDFSLQDEALAAEPIGEPLPDYFKESCELMKKIDFSKVDIATIAYGTNDYTAGSPLDSEDKYDIVSFGGALRYSIKKLSEAFPNIKIVVCTQTYRFWRTPEGEFLNDSNTRIWKTDILPAYVEKTKEVAKESGLYCIDNYKNSGISFETRNLAFSETDGTHPIEYGRRLIAKNISRELSGAFNE